MADISKQSVSGDFEVSRNMAAGGGLTVSGKTELGGRVVVKDWLDAPNIVGAGKGVFPSYTDLYARYPRPMGGWWAITDLSIDENGTFNGCVYVAVRGKWTLQTDMDNVPLQINVPDIGISESIEGLQGDVLALQANITSEATARQSADNTLQTNIDNEATARSNADNALQANIDKKQDALKCYQEDSDGGYAQIEVGDSVFAIDGNHVEVAAEEFLFDDSMVLNQAHVYNGLDKTEEGYALDARQGMVLQTNIDNEADARQKSDTTLQTNIDNEASARKGADDALQTNIDNEKTLRQEADSTLQSNIDNEASARKGADDALQTNIDNEKTLRQEADSTLQSNIDNEAEARKNADNTLQTNIDKKQDALTLYSESGEAASVMAGSFTYNGSEVVTEEELAAHTLTEDEIDTLMECFMFRRIGVICAKELECLMEGFEFVGLDGLVTKVEAKGDGLVELSADNADGVATVSGRTTIGSVEEEDVERMFDEVSKE